MNISIRLKIYFMIAVSNCLLAIMYKVFGEENKVSQRVYDSAISATIKYQNAMKDELSALGIEI